MTLHPADLKYSDYDSLPVGWPHDQGVKSLGYEVLAWAETYLAQPDGDTAGNPWRWRESQARFVAWWYALDERGEFLFNHGQIVLSKGAGKSPMAAILSCCELGGPVTFGGWDAAGEPIGKPHPSPIIALAAVSFEQTSNMSELLSSALSEGAADEVIDDLDPGIMRVRSRNGGIFRVAASDRSLEGQRATSAFLDEPQHWLSSNRGDKLDRAIRRNLMKTGGRALQLTNCWEPGEESVAEKTYLGATVTDGRDREGLRAQKRVLRWHPKIHVEDLGDTAAFRAALAQLYADFPWVDIERIIDEAQQDMSAAEIRRFFLNEISAADDALVSDAELSACQVPEAEWVPLRPGDVVTLGFDGGKTDDSTALVACRVEDRTFHVLGLWEKPKNQRIGQWEVPREAVDLAVRDARETFDVVGFYADVALWESYVDKWSREFRSTCLIKASANSMVGWDMRGRLQTVTRAVENLVGGILDAAVGWSMADVHGSKFREHFLNARRRANTWGVSFGKESRESRKKVDIVAATVLADMARADYEMSGKTRRKKGRVRVFG